MSKFRDERASHDRPRFRLAACGRCGGDAFLDLSDGAEWRRLQCARIVSNELSSHAGAPLPHALYYKQMAGRRAA